MCGQIRNGLIILRVLILGLAVFSAPHAIFAAPRKVPAAPSVSEADRAALAGPWKGTWTGRNFRYDAVMSLAIDANGIVSGTINWILRASPNANGANKIGLNAIENVRGTYYPDSATLALEGYGKADPNGIWELDKYLLVVSPTRQTMGGITEGHGAWTGQFFLSR